MPPSEPHPPTSQPPTPDLLTTIKTHVNSAMAHHDPSHNPAHIARVTRLAEGILSAERKAHPEVPYDETAVLLAALMHDLHDGKYTPAGVPTTGGVEDVLLSYGASGELANKVDKIVTHVSYSAERSNPGLVDRLITEDGLVELGIVQDADRLDALGAVGIGRCFTFLGAKGKERVKGGEGWEMENAIAHFGEKLERLEGMMKTESGRKMARVRTERLRVFKGWWEEEVGF